MIKLKKFLIIEFAILLCAFTWLFISLHAFGLTPQFLAEHCGCKLQDMTTFVALWSLIIIGFSGTIVLFTAIFAFLDHSYWVQGKK